MATDKFLESRNRAREEEEKNNPGNADDLAEAKIIEPEDEILERYKKLLAVHGISDKEKYIHKREQLYLMVSRKLTDAFIGKVIHFPSEIIDMLRMTAFVTGEDYLFTLISDKAPSEEQIRSWIDDYMKSSLAPAAREPAGTTVERSLDIMGRHMVRQQEIAGAQINRLTEYLKRMSEMVQEKSESDLAVMRAENQKERERAQKQIDLLSDENFRLSMKIEDSQEEAKNLAEEKKKLAAARSGASGMNQNSPDQEEGLFAHRRRMKENRRREEFISSVLGNGNFSREQLAVVERVVHKNFTLQQLQKICDPQVKPENMELLEAYYEKRRVHG